MPGNEEIGEILGVEYDDPRPHPGDNEETSGKLFKCIFIRETEYN